MLRHLCASQCRAGLVALLRTADGEEDETGHILWKARERDRGHDALPPKEEVPDEHDIEEEAMTKEPHSHIELIKMVHCSKNGAAFVVWQAAQGAARQVRPERRWQSLFVRGFRGHFNLGLLVVPEVIHCPCYLLGVVLEFAKHMSKAIAGKEGPEMQRELVFLGTL